MVLQVARHAVRLVPSAAGALDNGRDAAGVDDMSRLGQLLPDVVKRELKRGFRTTAGSTARCATTGIVSSRPSAPRVNARCPTCQALERHRLIWQFFESAPNSFVRREADAALRAEPMFSARWPG